MLTGAFSFSSRANRGQRRESKRTRKVTQRYGVQEFESDEQDQVSSEERPECEEGDGNAGDRSSEEQNQSKEILFGNNRYQNSQRLRKNQPPEGAQVDQRFGFGDENVSDKEKCETESAKAGCDNSDGIDYDGDGDIHYIEQEQQNTKTQSKMHSQPQVEQQFYSSGRPLRNASIVGQKRTHKYAKKDKRRYPDDDDEDYSESYDRDAESEVESKRSKGSIEDAGAQPSNQIRQKEIASTSRDYLANISGGMANDEDFRSKKQNRPGFAKKLQHESVSIAIQNQEKVQADEKAEYERRLQDEGVTGSFQTHEARIVKRIIGLDQKNRKQLDILCVVAWWPSPDDPQLIPFDAEVPYAEVREKAPKLLVEYFQKRTVLK